MSKIETTGTVSVMLAEQHDESKYKMTFPKLVSPKLDGIRCYIENGVAYSRNGKAIRNTSIQAFFCDKEFDGMDGELMSGEHDKMVFRRSTSTIMSESGGGDWHFHVFDLHCEPKLSFEERFKKLSDRISKLNSMKIKLVPHTSIESMDKLNEFEKEVLDHGFEGVMARNPKGLYKYGRATAKSQDLLKVKRFMDAEAVVVGLKQLIRKDGTAADMLGSFDLKRPDGLVFGCGSGFTEAERVSLWKRQKELIGKSVTYTYFDQGGYNAPRFPTFKGIREDI